MSLRLALLSRYLRRVELPYLARSEDHEAVRRRFEWQAKHVFRRVPGVAHGQDALAHDGAEIPCGVAAPAKRASRAAILYLHGGGYVLGSPRTHAKLAAMLASATGAVAFLPDYRLAPENVFPAAPDDALTAYLALCARGYEKIAVIGDSAGGGLSFALLQMLLEAGRPRPAAMVAFSPWADLTLSGASHETNRATEALLPEAQIRRCAEEYLAGADPADPLASPVFGRFRGAPPVLLQVSRSEVLLDDTMALARRLEEAGAEVLVQNWDGAPHVWQFFHGLVPEAGEAIAEAARFLGPHLR